jgi:hypothetical protein
MQKPTGDCGYRSRLPSTELLLGAGGRLRGQRDFLEASGGGVEIESEVL